MILVLDAILLVFVESLCELLDRVARSTPANECEHRLDLLAEVIDDVVFNLDLCGHRETLAIDVAIHITQTLDEQGVVLLTAVCHTDNGSRADIINVVGLRALAVLIHTRQITVIGGQLRERHNLCISMCVGHIFVCVVHCIDTTFSKCSLSCRLVDDVVDSRGGELQRLARLVLCPLAIEQLASLLIDEVNLAGGKHHIQLVSLRVEGTIGHCMQRAHDALGHTVALLAVAIAESGVNEYLISLLLELLELGAELRGEHRQSVCPLLAERSIGDSCRDAVP